MRQTTVQFGQVVQPSVVAQVAASVENLKVWWSTTSKSFTALCATDKGEVFTHGDVVKAHLALAAVLILIGIGGAL